MMKIMKGERRMVVLSSKPTNSKFKPTSRILGVVNYIIKVVWWSNFGVVVVKVGGGREWRERGGWCWRREKWVVVVNIASREER